MDSLKSLMDRKDYELVIKLTENSQDINYLFYRISAFLALGRGEAALETIKNNRMILQGTTPSPRSIAEAALTGRQGRIDRLFVFVKNPSR